MDVDYTIIRIKKTTKEKLDAHRANLLYDNAKTYDSVINQLLDKEKKRK